MPMCEPHDYESFWFEHHQARCRWCAFNGCLNWPPEQPVICIEYCTLWDEELLSDYLDEWICPWYKPGESLFRFSKLRWLYRLYLWVYRRLVRLRYGDWRKRWGCFPPPC